MNSDNALLLDACKVTGTKPDDRTGVGTDLNTSANSVSATDFHSGKGTCRKIGGKGMGLDIGYFGDAELLVSQQSLIGRRRQFHRAEAQGAKTTTTKLTTHDNGNLM